MDENYLNSINELVKLSNTCFELSKDTQGREVESWREEYATYIFAKLTAHLVSLLKLLPGTKLFELPDSFKLWDISSVAVLVRSLIESYFVFYYVGIDEVDEAEKEFRFIIWHLHSETERLKMLRFINSTNKDISQIEKEVEDYKKKILQNEFYLSLLSKEKTPFRKGEKGIHLTNSQIAERAGINPNYYKAAYKYLSSYTHTFPFSIKQIAVFKADDSDALKLLNTMSDYSLGFVSYSIRDFVKIFPDQKPKYDSVKDIIESWEIILNKFESAS